MPLGQKVGRELLVNTYTSGGQGSPTIASLAGGNFVVSWMDGAYGTSSSGTFGDNSFGSVKAQVFASNGTKLGSEFLVNTQTARGQGAPTVTGLPNGNFVVSWEDSSSSHGIKAQVFSALGAKIGTEFLVNTQTAFGQFRPTISGLANGNFVVSWDDVDGGTLGDSSSASTKAQVFSSSGAKVGTEFLVNTQTVGNQEHPTVTGLANGNFVVSWQDDGGTPGEAIGSSSIKAQMFSSTGAKISTEFLVNTQTAGLQVDPSIAALANGGFVVSWEDGLNSTAGSGTLGDTSASSVKAQVFDAAGTKVGTEFLVNTQTAGSQADPTVTGLANGNFVVSWEDGSGTLGDAEPGSIKGQMFSASGVKIGGEFLVNTQTTGSQGDAAITSLGTGGFAIGWADAGGTLGDASSFSVKAQLFSGEGATLETQGRLDTRTVGQFENFDHIVQFANPIYAAQTVTLEISGAGALDLTDELAIPGGGSRAAGVYASAEGNTITTGAGNDTLLGTTGSDVLNGGAGDDILAGDYTEPYSEGDYVDIGGVDVYDGGAGSDTIYDAYGQAKNISGGTGNDRIIIADLAANAALTGKVDGGTGEDVLEVASSTNLAGVKLTSLETLVTQTYVTTATAAQFEAFDRIVYYTNPYFDGTSVSLRLSGSGTLELTDELITATGGSRAATVYASTAGNTITTGAGGDTLVGNAGVDTFRSGAGSDVLEGHGGNDNLSGGTGADRMYGGSGNDTYTVDDVGDQVIETASDGSNEGGTEQVYASVSYTLGAFVENLLLTGTAAIDGTGNDLANKLTGNTAANILAGGGGNDLLIGNAGTDTLYGDAGNDDLSGGSDNDTLYGGTGNDNLNGGTGADRMAGGAGNDTYTVDDVGDQAIEAKGDGTDEGGTDTVNSSVSFTLGAFVEKLTLTGAAAINGTGNDLANTLTGNSGANTLTGGGGNDILSGGAGNDILIGGLGKDALTGGLDADTFVFGPANPATVDAVKDFSAAQGDKVGIVAGNYGLSAGHGLTAGSDLDPDWFAAITGSNANQGTASGHGQFLFNTTTHALLWDADGTGGAAATAIATFNSGASLTAADFRFANSDPFMV